MSGWTPISVLLQSIVINLKYSLVVLSFWVACNLNEEVSINKDMSLCAFIISDNDLDDHTQNLLY